MSREARRFLRPWPLTQKGGSLPPFCPHHRDAMPLRLAIRRNAPETMSMGAFSREGLLSLLESVESAISELQSRNEPTSSMTL